MQMKSALTASLASLIILSGCVRDKDIEIQKPIDINTKFIVNESSMTKISFDTIIDDLVLDTTSQDPSGSGNLNLEGNTILVESYEVDRPAIISAVIYPRSKGSKHSTAKTLKITVKNTSAKIIEETVEKTLDQRDELISLEEDYKAYRFIVDVAYLNKFIDYREKKELLEDFNPTKSDFYDMAQNTMDGLEITYQNYLAGSVADTQLDEQVKLAIKNLTVHSNYSNQLLLSISQFYEPFLSHFSDGSFYYDEVYGRVSKYVGNENLGHYQDGQWIFSVDYKILDSLFKDI